MISEGASLQGDQTVVVQRRRTTQATVAGTCGFSALGASSSVSIQCLMPLVEAENTLTQTCELQNTMVTLWGGAAAVHQWSVAAPLTVR